MATESDVSPMPTTNPRMAAAHPESGEPTLSAAGDRSAVTRGVTTHRNRITGIWSIGAIAHSATHSFTLAFAARRNASAASTHFTINTYARTNVIPKPLGVI